MTVRAISVLAGAEHGGMHELLIYLVGGLATLSGACASVILSWLRADIRSLAKAIEEIRQSNNALAKAFEHQAGILEGKGLLK